MPIDPRRLLSCLDLTLLDEATPPATIDALCAKAIAPVPTAAVCVYPEYIDRCRRTLAGHPVRVATVTNFPDGSADLERCSRETRRALAAGAQEIDMVFPWRALLEGCEQFGSDLVAACKLLCEGKAQLKVILETGSLAHPSLIARASHLAITAGADFLKTSTGKVTVNATMDAARVMLETIRAHGGHCGFKAAGGIRSPAVAAAYLDLAEELLGRDWANPARFRIGASSLYDELRASLAP